ncbi:Glucose-6-phosphate isomerase [Paracholeplasma brassicae]|uniref:Glucose-6-phosphate isomerase n=1 Tax=Acholeplasma brassicae TaxID=61635 RepID=U4KTG1_9MOLU|nr:glucose-6-phosphate isomerase [Paracholeplasma brassicae]CCV66629.1 Glucose-6-phosphate isomerase [Paracholeplasma brassicae]
MIKVNDKYALPFLTGDEQSLNERVAKIHKQIHEKTGKGNDFLGWLDLPKTYDKEEFSRIKKAAQKIRNQSQVLVVVGIGGSYLGAKAALEMLNSPFKKKGDVEVIFVGHQLSAQYTNELLSYLEDKEFSINVISKSGTTTEPAIAFRIMKNYLESRYGKVASKERIFVTTDQSRGALRSLTTEEGYESFVISDDIGGRFSVLTAVGLLPIAASGVDIDQMMQGALDAYNHMLSLDNEAYKYAKLRYRLYKSGKKIEILVNYEPSLSFLSEWWKQLFAESEGKENKALFAASANFSTDLHSIGQLIQEGERNLFETVIKIGKTEKDQQIPSDPNDLDGLNYLAGKSIQHVNDKAFLGTLLAHVDGGAPNIILEVPTINPYYFGYTVYFFMKAVAMSAYLLDVNPFDQPGVEAYKKNMFALLGKKGFEELKETLLNKLEEK